MKRKFFIDTDTASDDAVALIIALRHGDIDVVGISVVAGNVPLEMGVQNALYTRELCRSSFVQLSLYTAQMAWGISDSILRVGSQTQEAR
jgi:inosine-uridine nucleoside N-ribohydrolase